MNKIIFVSLILAVARPAVAEEEEQLQKYGGAGKVVFVSEDGVSATPIEVASRKLGNVLMFNTECKVGEFNRADPAESFAKAGGNVAVFVVDSKDKALPISLIAMEAKWGVVNVNGLSSGAIEKEVLRVATVLLGGACSKFKASTMRPVFSAADLDTNAGAIITFDSLINITNYAPALGLKQYEMLTKEDAIEAGYLKK